MELYNKESIKVLNEKVEETYYMPKALFNGYRTLRLETKLAYIAIVETLRQKPNYTQENVGFIKVSNPQIQENLSKIANKPVDQEKVNKYLDELVEASLIEVNKQDIYVYSVE